MAHQHGNLLRRLSVGLIAAITGGSALLLRAERQAEKKVKQTAKKATGLDEGRDLHKAKIIMQDPDGHTILTEVIRGQAGQTVPIHLQLPDEWEIASPEIVPHRYTFHQSGNNDILVDLQHAVTTGTESKTVHRNITLIRPDGSQNEKVQTATFKRTVKTNHVHEQTTYGDWEPERQELPAFTAPVITGYHADKEVAPPPGYRQSSGYQRHDQLSSRLSLQP